MSKQEKIRKALETFMLIKRHSTEMRDEFLKKFGMNSSQIDILCLIASKGQMTMKEMATLMNSTPGAITQHTDKMIEQGIVKRVNDLKDRRKIFIDFSKKGEETFKEIIRRRSEYGKRLLEDFNEEELDTMIDFHQRILDKLNSNTKL